MRRFYFTSENHCDGDNPCNDHCGNIRGARTIAQKVANELNETVYINDCYTENIVDVIEPDYPVENSESGTVSETVENSYSDEKSMTVKEKILQIISLAMSIKPTDYFFLSLDWSNSLNTVDLFLYKHVNFSPIETSNHYKYNGRCSFWPYETYDHIIDWLNHLKDEFGEV